MTANNDNFYQQIELEVQQAVQEFGLDNQLSGSMAAGITMRLQKLLCKNSIYFRIKVQSKQERYAAIKRDFNGANHNEVCKKHGISRSTLYRALEAEPSAGQGGK